jgi:hypothetical protein
MLINDKNINESFKIKLKVYPKELAGSWFNFTIIEDHPILAGICSVYFDNLYPSGTIVISEKIINKYPDIYATWDKNYRASRMFVSPKLRKSGKGKNALLIGDEFIRFLGNDLLYSYGNNPNGDFLVKGAYSLKKDIDEIKVNDSDMFDFRDPAYPVIHFDKRFIKYEN